MNQYMRMREIGIMGASLGTGNRGVSALAASVIELITEACPAANVSLLIGNKRSEPFELRSRSSIRRIPVVNYRLSLRSWSRKHFLWILLASVLYRLVPVGRLRRWLVQGTPWLRFVSEADLILDIRGGDSFSDIYGVLPFLIDGALVCCVLLVRRKIGLLPQTYGPYRTWIARKVASFILSRAEMILSRDRESITTVEALIGKTERCQLCPDVAFALKVYQPEKLNVSPALNGTKRDQLIGLNVSGLMFRGGHTQKNMFGLKLDYGRFLVRLVEGFLSDSKNHLLLVPHTFAPPDRVESDPAACREIRCRLSAELQTRVHMIEGEYDQSEIKAVIGRCDFFVGSRMHACIAALSQGIPAVGIAYSKKFVGVFETVGVAESVVDGRVCDVEQALRKTMDIFQQRESIRRVLWPKVCEAQSRLHAVFGEMLHQDLS